MNRTNIYKAKLTNAKDFAHTVAPASCAGQHTNTFRSCMLYSMQFKEVGGKEITVDQINIDVRRSSPIPNDTYVPMDIVERLPQEEAAMS